MCGPSGEQTTRYMGGALNAEGAARIAEALRARPDIYHASAERDGYGGWFVKGRRRGAGYFEFHDWHEAGRMFPY